jgi:hypothetical protein
MGRDGLGEGEEKVQQDPRPHVHPPFEVNQASLPHNLDPGARDCRAFTASPGGPSSSRRPPPGQDTLSMVLTS